MNAADIRSALFELRDENYRDFQSKLIPNVDPEIFIGVRTPQLRSLAKRLASEGAEEFLACLPHEYFDENQLHALIISLTKDFGECVGQVESFLPYVDNWATCDQLLPKCFAKHRAELLDRVEVWLGSERVYTVRFAVGMLMKHYLGSGYEPRFSDAVAAIESDEYYVNMMRAWYFATALAVRFDDVLPYVKEERLDPWTRRMTVRKARESYRLTNEQKDILRRCLR